MGDFLHEDNLCGQTILALVSRGNSILAEMLRLAGMVPEVLLNGKNSRDPQQRKYAEVLFGFQYLKSPDVYEEKMVSNDALAEVDATFMETYETMMRRFYNLFVNVCKFVEDFHEFVEHVEEGFYISHTIEDVLVLNRSGKQLMCEALYLFGMMLLTLEDRIPGPARERIIVSLLRQDGESSLENFEGVTKLCRATGYDPLRPLVKPANYPEEFFARFPMRTSIVRMVIDRLRSDDVYNMIRNFPAPEHRSVALANQASMIYVILYFMPSQLKGDRAMMREIVDKHFNDNWVITIYMGRIVNLREEWERYPAAWEAMRNTLEPRNVRDLAKRHDTAVNSCLERLARFLTEGVLSEDYVIEEINDLLNCLRSCNATVRWLLLHSREKNSGLMRAIYAGIAGLPMEAPVYKSTGLFARVRKPTAEEVAAERAVLNQAANANRERVIQLLLLTGQLEYKLKAVFETLLGGKEERWENSKRDGALYMRELAEYFSGARALSKVSKDEHLQAWFTNMADHIEGLDYEHSTQSKTGRKIQKLLEALREVEQFEKIDTSLQVKEFLTKAREFLTSMVKAVGVKPSVLQMVDFIADLTYAWEILDDYVVILHRRVDKDPRSVVLLRATFLKLASIIDVPLSRIIQANSADLDSVCHYYSGELVAFVRKVLSVVPHNVFQILSQIIVLQTTSLGRLPAKLEVYRLIEVAQLDARYNLAKCTHRISVFTEGILAMEKTLLGSIDVDPRKILAAGIRKELVTRISQCLDTNIRFTFPDETLSKKKKKKKGSIVTRGPPPVSAASVEAVLTEVSTQLDGFRRSLEYIQDYLAMYGLKIWQQEFARIVRFNTELECNRFLKKKVLPSQSIYQSRSIPIPRFAPMPRSKDSSFIGRMLRALLYLSDSRKTVFAPACSGWYAPDGTEVAGLGLFTKLSKAIGVHGLCGMDRLLGFRVSGDLQNLLEIYSGPLKPQHRPLQAMTAELRPFHSLPSDGITLHSQALKKLSRSLAALLPRISRIGQAQLLRRAIANQLFFSSRLDSNLLSCSLGALNDSIMADIHQHYRDPEKYPFPQSDNDLLPELNDYLQASGMTDPLTQIYITSEPKENLPLLLVLFVLHHLPNMIWDNAFGSLVAVRDRKGVRAQIDGAPIVAGIATLLKQFHPDYTNKFVGMLAQYVRSVVHLAFSKSSDVSRLPYSVTNVLLFFKLFCKFASIPFKALEGYLPTYLFCCITSAPVARKKGK